MAKRPTKDEQRIALVHVRSLARAYTDTAVKTLAGIAAHGKNEAARVAASNSLLDRGWGKAPQTITGDEDGGPIKISWDE